VAHDKSGLFVSDTLRWRYTRSRACDCDTHTLARCPRRHLTPQLIRSCTAAKDNKLDCLGVSECKIVIIELAYTIRCLMVDALPTDAIRAAVDRTA